MRLTSSVERWRITIADTLWLLPVLVYAVLRRYPTDLQRPIATILGAGLVVLVLKAPDRALALLAGLIVFDRILFPILFWLGMPLPLVNGAGSWNEVLLVALAVAALHHALEQHHRFDGIDRLAIAYIAVCTAYLLIPSLLATGDIRSWDVRLISFRMHVSMFVLFLAARHIPTREQARRWFVRAVLVAVVIVGFQTLYEFFNSSGWNTFATKTLQLNRFNVLTTGFSLPRPFDIRATETVGGRVITRAGSVAFDPIRICFFFIVPFGLALESINRRRPARLATLAAVLAATGATLTLTRSAVIAVIVTALAALRPGVGRIGEHRARLGLILLGAIALATPGLAGGALGARTTAAAEGTDLSSDAHLDRFWDGVDTMVANPLGLGLGAGPSVPQDYKWDANPENSYLLVGDEMGVIPMVMFIALLFATVRRLGKAARGETADDVPLASGLRIAGFGLIAAGMFLQVWTDLPTSLIFWGGAGLALNVGIVGATGASEPRTEPITAWSARRA